MDPRGYTRASLQCQQIPDEYNYKINKAFTPVGWQKLNTTMSLHELTFLPDNIQILTLNSQYKLDESMHRNIDSGR